MQQATTRRKKRSAPTPPPDNQYFVPWGGVALDGLDEDRPTEPYSITERLPAAAPARIHALPAPAAAPNPTPAALPAMPTAMPGAALLERLPPLAPRQWAMIGAGVLVVLLAALWLLGQGGAKATAGKAAAGVAPQGSAPGKVADRAASAAGNDLAAMSAADLLPTGIPITRNDWVITKDYAAHGGDDPVKREKWGAVDFAFWHNKDAVGADIIATHAGKVKLLTDDPTYGNLVYVQGPHYTTTYGPLQKFNVTEGQVVRRGDVIGGMGSTGSSSGPHVDYQVWQDGKNQNPMNYCQCAMQGSPQP